MEGVSTESKDFTGLQICLIGFMYVSQVMFFNHKYSIRTCKSVYPQMSMTFKAFTLILLPSVEKLLALASLTHAARTNSKSSSC
jgi:hypothetical protein